MPLPLTDLRMPLDNPKVSRARVPSMAVMTQHPAPPCILHNCNIVVPNTSAALSTTPFGSTPAAALTIDNVAEADRRPVQVRVPLPKAPPQRQRHTTPAPRHTVLVLCGGPDERPDGLVALFRESGLGANNYDTVNANNGDVADTYIFDDLVRKVDPMEFSALFASPPCTPFSVLHQRPGRGSPPMVTATGSERYGIRGLPPKTAERVKGMMLVCIRVAIIIKRFILAKRPVFFETVAFMYEGQTSVFNLDEYKEIRGMTGVQIINGVQCPFNATAAKETSWLSYLVDVSDMPPRCPHAKRDWFSNRTNRRILAAHPPSHGDESFSSTRRTQQQLAQWRPDGFIATKLAAYPHLLNRYIVSKFRDALGVRSPILTRPPSSPTTSTPAALDTSTATPIAAPTLDQSDEHMTQARFKFVERVQLSQRVRGAVAITEKEEADRRAIGGLRDAADSVSRMHLVAAFGRKLSSRLRQLIQFNEDTHTVANTLDQSWITATIDAIGSEEPDAGPPAEAIKSVKELIAEACDFTPSTSRTKLTNVDADLLEAWRMAASHPDNYIAKWMGVGAPAGILNPIPDP